MDFKTTNAEVTLQNINYTLGLKSDIDVLTSIDDLKIKWSVDITPKEWGIKAIDVSISDIFIQIEWKVYKEDLSLTEITSLLCKNDMFHSVFIDHYDYVVGEYKIFGNMFNIVENLEVNGGILEIEEVVIDFMENEIHIL
jgi:hypothetical protein